MNQTLKNLAFEARKLTAEERAALIDDLLVSLHQQDDAWTKHWLEEADRRCAAFDAGVITAHDADDVLADMKQRLARHRAR